MTNVLELAAIVTISLVTNITETTNERGCRTCDGIRRNHWLLAHVCNKSGEPYYPATIKWVRREVFEFTRIQSKDGKYSAEIERRPISITRQQFAARTTWDPIGKEEQEVSFALPSSAGCITNVLSVTNAGPLFRWEAIK